MTYGFIGATWLYFTVLVLTHMLGIYGWTFDSHDSADLKSWGIFVMIPFLLPWLMQAWILFEINPTGIFDGFKGVFSKKKSGKIEAAEVNSKDEMVIIENEEEKNIMDESVPPQKNDSISDTMEQILCLATSLFICGLVSVILAIITTRLISGSSTDDLLFKFFISLICVTWINCSVSPFILFSGEMEVEPSRRYVDAVIRAVVRSVHSYLSLYVPDTGLLSQFMRRFGEKAKVEEDVTVDDSTGVLDDESGEVC